MTSKGYGWADCQVAFSCSTDKNVGTVPTLVKELQKVIKEEVGRPVPLEAPVVGSLCRKMPVLGTLSQQAITFRESPSFTRDQLRTQHVQVAAAAAAKTAKRAREQHDEHALEQPAEAPKVDKDLVGKRVEHLVQLEVSEVNESGKEELKYLKQWLPAAITTFSSSTACTRSSSSSFWTRSSPA